MTDLEDRGIPGVGVASSVFVKAADVQKEALGSATDMIFVPHPIQDRTDAEMRALAEEAIESLLARLTR